MFILPTLAGGGSCSPIQQRSVLGCTVANCNSWIRTQNATYWLQALSHNIGLQSAQLATATAAGGDLTDPTFPSNVAYKRFNSVYRSLLGWLPTSFLQPRTSDGLATLTSSSAATVPTGAVGVIALPSPSTVFYVSLRTHDSGTLDMNLPEGVWDIGCLCAPSYYYHAQSLSKGCCVVLLGCD